MKRKSGDGALKKVEALQFNNEETKLHGVTPRKMRKVEEVMQIDSNDDEESSDEEDDLVITENDSRVNIYFTCGFVTLILCFVSTHLNSITSQLKLRYITTCEFSVQALKTLL